MGFSWYKMDEALLEDEPVTLLTQPIASGGFL
jgi:hypothetical protein